MPSGPFLFLIIITVSLSCIQKTAAQQPVPLFAAIEKNDLETVKELLRKGTDPNMADGDGDNALMYAAIYASADCMKLLLSHRALPNTKNKSGETALMWCTHDAAKLQLLLDNGADPNAKSNYGNTPLMIAAKGYGQYAIVKMLVDKGVDCKVVNTVGETPLIRAAFFGDSLLLHLLCEKGNNILTNDKNNSSALIYAISNENKAGSLWLIDKIADTEAGDSVIAVALTYAVVLDDMDIVNALLKKIRNVNWQDDKGYTSLIWAVFNEHTNDEMIKALLVKGADVNHKARDGSTPLSWAMKKGHTSVVDLLLHAGAKK